MRSHAAQPLFAWGCLDNCPTLRTIRDFLDAVPDEALLAGLRFLDVLGTEPHQTALRGVFDDLARRLGVAGPDLGRHTAGDATALSARPKADAKAVAAETAQGLPQPTGGRKEYLDDEGRVEKVVEWFGYKLHLLVDVEHEVTLAFDITDPKAGDNEGSKPCSSRPRPTCRRAASKPWRMTRRPMTPRSMRCCTSTASSR